MSIFKWNRWARWQQGVWQQQYTWRQRQMESVNQWVQTLRHDQLGLLWEQTVSLTRINPIQTFMTCRTQPLLSALTSLATQTYLPPKLGELGFLPRAAGEERIGGYLLNVSEDSNDQENVVTLGLEPAATMEGQVAMERRRSRRSLFYNALTDEQAFDSKIEFVSKKFLSSTDKNRWLQVSNSGSELAQLPASCYTNVKATSKYVGQIIGDCLSLALDQPLAAAVEVCFPLQGEIPVNMAFTTYDFGRKAAISGGSATETIAPMGISVTLSGTGETLCGLVQDQAVYCPIRRYSDYTSTSVVSADTSCDAVEQVNQQIQTQTTQLVADGFTGDLTSVLGNNAQGAEAVGFGDAGITVDVATFTNNVQDTTTVADATINTTTTTTPEPKTYNVNGDMAMAMNVPDNATPESLMADTTFTNILMSSLATVLDVSVSDVTINSFSFARRALREIEDDVQASGERRSLASRTVQADYTVNVVGDPSNVESLLNDPQRKQVFATSMQQSVNQGLQMQGLSATYGVTSVESLGSTTVEVVDEEDEGNPALDWLKENILVVAIGGGGFLLLCCCFCVCAWYCCGRTDSKNKISEVSPPPNRSSHNNINPPQIPSANQNLYMGQQQQPGSVQAGAYMTNQPGGMVMYVNDPAAGAYVKE
jgi:hypothetical protein